MTYIFFNDVLAALGKKINFDSISNMYGRTVFDKKSGDAINKMIEKANPLVKPSTTNSAQTLLSMPGKTTIIRKDKENSQMKDFLGDMDWILK